MIKNYNNLISFIPGSSTKILEASIANSQNYYIKISTSSLSIAEKEYSSISKKLLNKSLKEEQIKTNFSNIVVKDLSTSKFQIKTKEDWKNFGKSLGEAALTKTVKATTEIISKGLQSIFNSAKKGSGITSKSNNTTSSGNEGNKDFNTFTSISTEKDLNKLKIPPIINFTELTISEDITNLTTPNNIIVTEFSYKSLVSKPLKKDQFTSDIVENEYLLKNFAEEEKLVGTLPIFPEIKEFEKSTPETKSIKTPIQLLNIMSQIPDFLGNTFTAYLSNIKSSNEKAKSLISNEFSFRLEGINIPLPKKKEYDVKFLNTSIKKIESMTTINRTLSISLRADENFYINSLFEELSGVNRWKLSGSSPLPSLAALDYESDTDSEFTLYVIHNLLAAENTSIRNLEPNISNNILIGNYIIYTFKNVRVLGRSSAISLSATNAEPLSISYDLSFRTVTSEKWLKDKLIH